MNILNIILAGKDYLNCKIIEIIVKQSLILTQNLNSLTRNFITVMNLEIKYYSGAF